eukprot:TRINITY_DN7946_c0_g1_i1.p1 TRINITY_DN7946_c0_g1~~TRINITY_DN7946_c0_g1_i1.p1  ORF type:complete len:516 (+),score=82.94 TRINITY_DN7946_c0_g1_i1:91-1638(+)
MDAEIEIEIDASHPRQQRTVHLRSVPNCRDLGGHLIYDASHRVVGRTRWGLIYRSGRPVHASSDDVSHLLNRMNIRTIIDLRTPDEQVKDGASQLLSHFTPDPISDEKTLTKTQIIRGVSLFASAIIGLWIYIVTSSLFKSLAGIMVFFSAVIVYLVLLGFNKRRNSFMPKDNRNPKKRELERGHLANSNYDDSQPSCSEALTLSIAEIPSTFGLSSSSRSCLCGRSPSSPTSSITSDSTACQQNRNSSPRKTEAPSQTQNGGIAKSILGRFTQQKGAYELVDRQQMIPISIDEDEEEIELGLNSDIDPDIDIEINMNLGLSPREDLRDGLGASLFSSADPPRSSKGRHPTEKMPLIKTTQCMESSDQGRKLVPGSMPRRYVRISLANNSFIRKGVLGLAPYHVQIPVLAWLLIGRKDMAAYVLTKGCVSQWNLTEFYTRLIEYSQPQILKCLELFADPNNYPIVFHCTHGKDRTGVIAGMSREREKVSQKNILYENMSCTYESPSFLPFRYMLA